MLQELEAYRSQELQYVRSSEVEGVPQPESPVQAALEAAEPDLPRVAPVRHREQQQQLNQARNGGGAGADGGAGDKLGQQDKAAAAAARATRAAPVSAGAPALEQYFRGYRTDAAAALALTGLTAGFAAGAALQQQHTWLRSAWLSCLLGPFG